MNKLERVKIEPESEEDIQLSYTEIGIEFVDTKNQFAEDFCFIDGEATIFPIDASGYNRLDADDAEGLALWLLRRVKEIRAKNGER